MAREFKNLLWAVAFTVVIYLYITYKTDTLPQQEQAIISDAAGLSPGLADAKTIHSDGTTSVAGKTVRLVDVNEAGSVIVSVNDKLAIINGSEIIYGLKITVIETFYSKDKTARAATLIISEA